MERHEILEAMGELKLYGMRASFDEIAGKGLARRDELYPLIASLIRAERTHRQARSISYRIGGAAAPWPTIAPPHTFLLGLKPPRQCLQELFLPERKPLSDSSRYLPLRDTRSPPSELMSIKVSIRFQP